MHFVISKATVVRTKAAGTNVFRTNAVIANIPIANILEELL